MAGANIHSHRAKRRKTRISDLAKIETSQDDSNQSDFSNESKTTPTHQKIVECISKIETGQSYIGLVLSKLKLIPTLARDAKRVRDLPLDKPCRILIIGETGAGKSRSITALLDTDQLLPTSGNGDACTAAPIEVHYNNDDKMPYKAEYKYMTHAQLHEDFDIVQSALNADEIDIEATQGPIARFKSLYPKLTNDQFKTMTFDQVLASNEVCGLLGKSLPRSYKDKKAFCAELSGRASTATGNSSTWALLDMVRLYVKHPLLENGLVLVDVPGVGDDNATRNARATQYIQDCSAVCIMTPCIRAISNVTFRGLIKRALRQVQFSDRLGCIVLVCTKADDVDLTEVRLSLSPEGVEELTAEIQAAQKNRDEIKARINNDSRDLEKKAVDADRCRKDLPRWKRKQNQANNGKTNIGSPNSPVYTVAIMNQKSDNSYDLDELKLAVQQVESARKQLEADMKKLRASLPKLKAQANDLDARIMNMNLEWNRRTVGTRAEYIRRRQREAYIKEVRAHDAEAMKAAQDVNPKFRIEPSEPFDSAALQSQVPVFVVSAKAYQGHLGYPEGQAAMAVIENIDDTEIRALQAHLSAIASAARHEHLSYVQLQVDTVLSTLNETLRDSTETHCVDLVKARQAIDEFITILADQPDSFQHCVTVALRSLRSLYKAQFADLLPKIKAAAIAKALSKMNLFADTPDKNIPPRTKGLYYAEYKAAVRKKGSHCGSRVNINFNETVAGAVKLNIEKLLKRLFTAEGAAERSAKDVLGLCRRDVLDVMGRLHGNFEVRAVEAQIAGPTVGDLALQLGRRKEEVRVIIERAKKKIGDVYGEACSLVVMDILRAWLGVFERAKMVSGNGARYEVIEILGKSLEDGDGVVGQALKVLDTRTVEGFEEVMKGLKRDVGILVGSMVVDYEQAVRGGRDWEGLKGDDGAVEDCRKARIALDDGLVEGAMVEREKEVEVKVESDGG